MRKVYWLGEVPELCEACGKNKLDKVMVDGPATRGGPWGLICITCHENSGVGLGTGRGQKYEKQPDGQWLKVAG